MSEPETDVLSPKPLTTEDVHKLIGSLYLEIDFLRRENARLRAHIEGNGALPS